MLTEASANLAPGFGLPGFRQQGHRVAVTAQDVGLWRCTPMGFLHNLKLWLSPPKMSDPDFGNLTFMHIGKHPEKSYWECEWTFPPTGTVVDIALQGRESGPDHEARQFYLGLSARFNSIVKLCRPRLERVFREWRDEQLPQDIFTVVRLTGFDVENPQEQAVRWNVSFETTNADWLGITISFIGDIPLEPVVDS